MNKAFCEDCPDHEPCSMGASCEFTRGVAAIAAKYESIMKPKGKTKIMANTPKTNATPADVAAQAVEEKLVKPTVPAPTEGEKKSDATEDNCDESYPKYFYRTRNKNNEVVEFGTDSFKSFAGHVLKRSKKFILASVATSAAIVVAVRVVNNLKTQDEPDVEETNPDEQPEA